jgi:RNA polymerase sigma-70 factor, ECF subfamily
MTSPLILQPETTSLSDEDIVARVIAGEAALFEIIMRRHNQRLYRVARAILRDDGESEDVMQDAYVRAYKNLAQFAGRAKFSTWLTRIAVHEALSRKHRRRNIQELDAMLEPEQSQMQELRSREATPEQGAVNRELRGVLEAAIGELPDKYRTVFVLREVEEMTTSEAADALDLTEENVKIRLHRAKALLRKQLFSQVGSSAHDVLQFHLSRCDRVVARVFLEINSLPPFND